MDQAYLDAVKTRTVRNRHGSAKAAADKWLRGSLWGNPIRTDGVNIHIYGVYIRNWTQVWVDFRSDSIIVVRPPST